jgi:predicted nuclease of predicted toxin-antitoxin system
VSARLLLDEMFSPQIASELVRRGHDVVAVAAAPELAGLPDEQVLEWAASQGRCLVTENVKDHEVLRRAAAAQGRTHAGLLSCAPRRFPRDRRHAGALVVAVDKLAAAGRLPGPDDVGWLA